MTDAAGLFSDASATINVTALASSFTSMMAPTITYGALTDTISGQITSNAANGSSPREAWRSYSTV